MSLPPKLDTHGKQPRDKIPKRYTEKCPFVRDNPKAKRKLKRQSAKAYRKLGEEASRPRRTRGWES